MSFYPADLARIHDEGFGDFPRAAACELLRRLPPGGRVVELGCGTGISCEILADAGYDVVGIDISSDMLDIARRRAPRAEFRLGSVWDAELPACVAVTAIGEIVNYAADDRAGIEQLPELFARIRAALLDDGVFLFDFATPGRGASGARHSEREDWQIEVAHREEGDVLERRMTITTRDGSREETHRLKLYSEHPIRELLEAAGFEPERLHQYCDFAWGPGYAAFAATVRPEAAPRL